VLPGEIRTTRLSRVERIKRMKSAYILSAYPAGLGVIRALRPHGVPLIVGYDSPKEIGRKSKFIQELLRLPSPEDLEAAYIDALLKAAHREPGDILIPTSDATLAAVSRNKPLLQEKYQVACPDWSVVEQFIDKKHTAALAEAVGVPAPQTLLPRRLEDIEEWAPRLHFPCLAKPSQVHLFSRHFPRKMTRVENLDELLQAYREAQAIGVELMIQEYIPGEDALGANYNAYYWEGKPLVEFTAHKIRNAPPEMGSPCVLVSQKIPAVVELGRKILGAVGYSGYACTEFKLDPRDGVYKLMEVNARPNLSTSLAVRCGINFPWLQYQHLAEGILPQAQDFETGIFWIDISRDLGYRLVNFGREHLTVNQFLAPYFQRHVFAVFDGSDPYPALYKAADTIKEAFAYVFSVKTRQNLQGNTVNHRTSIAPLQADAARPRQVK
ncbi:MAG: hypothetical protein PHQ40_15535, partial [Anaerolineaceae bacterium]|nr:hypothetical protein [Anaerolineaceae bacterium]